MYNQLVQPDALKASTFDLVIIGTGIAGLYTALTLDPKYNIMLVTKDQLYESNSNYAQGGIAAALEESDFEKHVMDTLEAGSNYNDEATVNVVIKEARENIQKLIELGVNFDKRADGTLRRTKEGGHSSSRILHYKDSTGREIIRALTEGAKKRENIYIYENTFAIDLVVEKNQVKGIIFQRNLKRFYVEASKTIIASGGIGKLFKNSTNSLVATGDGVAMALRASAEVIDMEFIQFHPTALNIDESRNFLISEALRGEGAVLRNHKGERFMEKYHILKDLAPRDIVAQSIFIEMKANDTDGVFLDITEEDSEYVKNRFPQIYEYCLKYGINITKDYIPVVPVQHYLMGGIQVDLNGSTSIKNLYACGEVARTGLHGANRLASNSLLEAIVLGNRIAKDIGKNVKKNDNNQMIHPKSMIDSTKQVDYSETIKKIREIMSSNVFIVRYESNLIKALEAINRIIELMEENNTIEYFEVMNMLITSKKIIEDSIDRKESLGSHKIIIDK
ncbi:MAG TPA: L-aspartate oxidase [Clostridia bacterium]|nr:L-aspartate oxidase [Clostridia bacterium]